ncbi:Defensin-like protein 6 [Striga hermonthica]|uniref:Defensin-like protein 6 n=1 Tax=Striga hermonthica TaxID=68872 RepID=A0A9N7R9E7_STRHE|nr:Defensin-like protein 6 [Striga hermonthica]
MEKKASMIVLLLLLLLADELMVGCEARTCYIRSRKYRGSCYLKRHAGNCKTICKKEKYSGGVCKGGRCTCWKKCAGSSEVGGPLEIDPPSVAKAAVAN